jgi:surfeit locus 1 family protein
MLWVFPGVTFGLGVWQLYRLDWKLKLIDQAERKMSEDSIPLKDVLV